MISFNKMILLIFALLCSSSFAIGIPLHQGPRCMIIQGGFDSIKLQAKFPSIPNKKEDEKFKLSLLDYSSEQILFDVLLDQKTIYRKNLELKTNKIYHLCIEVYSRRNYFDPKTEQMYVQYMADEDFDALIGTFQVPVELRGQANLQYIYNMSQSINHLNKRIAQNQEKEREIQDSMASSNLHKNQRITMLTVIQCTIIVLSGIYQVLALRRFLIDKNLY